SERNAKCRESGPWRSTGVTSCRDESGRPITSSSNETDEIVKRRNISPIVEGMMSGRPRDIGVRQKSGDERDHADRKKTRSQNRAALPQNKTKRRGEEHNRLMICERESRDKKCSDQESAAFRLFVPSYQQQNQDRGEQIIEREHFGRERPLPERWINGEKQRCNRSRKLRSRETECGEINDANRERVAYNRKQIDSKGKRTEREQTEKMPKHREQRITRRMRYTQGHCRRDQFGRIADHDVARGRQEI